MFSRKFTRSIAAVAAAIMVAAGAYGIISATASNPTATAVTTTTVRSGPPGRGGGGTNARSGPAPGGTAGTAGSVTSTSIPLTTSAGQKVAVKTTSSTKYAEGAGSVSPSAVKRGTSVLVLGTVNGSTITATEVIVEVPAAIESTSVIPFRRDAPSTATQAGQIPANYKEGSGTIISGMTANKATEAALLAYPGGVVDRVVKLSNGEYEVHNIGVNWPHHIFVSKSLEVVGAD
jgi:hypothetical protein